jgi:hypothetical protein
LSHDDRERIGAERSAALMALPDYTLVRIGLRYPERSTQVGGGLFVKVKDGLIPARHDRDHDARWQLRREAVESHPIYTSQEWAFEVIAEPPSTETSAP